MYTYLDDKSIIIIIVLIDIFFFNVDNDFWIVDRLATNNDT